MGTPHCYQSLFKRCFLYGIHCRPGLSIYREDVKSSWTLREGRKHRRRNQAVGTALWIRTLVSLHYFLDGVCLCLSSLHYGSETKGPPEETRFSVAPLLEETLSTGPNTQRAQWITKSLFSPLWEVSQAQVTFFFFFNKACLSCRAGLSAGNSGFR